MVKQFYFKHFSLACHLFTLSLNVKWFNMTLSDSTIPNQSGLGSYGNEVVFPKAQALLESYHEIV